jgi:hypothetical protein
VSGVPGGNALELALALLRAPGERHALRESALPSGIERLLTIAAGAEPDEVTVELARSLGESPERLREAAQFYAREVLFHRDADAYRALGVGPDAPSEQIKAHHRLLQLWLHPDRQRSEDDSVFAARVNIAWNRLRNDERRRKYDLELAREGQQEPGFLVPATQRPAPAWRSPPQPDRVLRPWQHRLPVIALVGVCLILGWLAVRNNERAPDAWSLDSNEPAEERGMADVGSPVATMAEAAKVEAAKAETARLQLAKAEAAKAQAARLQFAKVEAAKAQVAKLQLAKAEAARAQAARLQLAKAEAAKAQAARLQLAKAEAAKAQAARLQLAKAEAAKAQAARLQLAKAEAAKAQAARLQLAKAEAARAQAARLQLAKAEAAKTQAARLQLAKAEAVKAQATKSQLAKAEAAKAQAAKLQLAKAEAAKAKAAKLQLAKAEAAKAQAAKSQLAKAEAAKAQQQSVATTSVQPDAPPAIATDEPTIARIQQARHVGATLLQYMATVKRASPPIWNSPAIMSSADGLRQQLHQLGRARIGTPQWRIGSAKAVLTSTYQVDGVEGAEGRGRVTADMVWREDRWLVVGLSVERTR